MARTHKRPRPRKRGKTWLAQVTMADGKRLSATFDTFREADDWIGDKLRERDSGRVAALDGPRRTTLAAALAFYAQTITVRKKGAKRELGRINRYLRAAGLAPLALRTDDMGHTHLVSADESSADHPFQRRVRALNAQRPRTLACIEALANKPCSDIQPSDIDHFVSVMAMEKLGNASIRLELALLSHLFNVARTKWSWSDLKNPTDNVVVQPGGLRFVQIKESEYLRIVELAQQADNPYLAAAVVLALETALRKSTMRQLTWDQIDLETRVFYGDTKGGEAAIPLSQTAVETLSLLKRTSGASGSDRVLPVSESALHQAWKRVRDKAGLPQLQFRDLRHVLPTLLARNKVNQHVIQQVLGHRTSFMAKHYVNLVKDDALKALDEVRPLDKNVMALLPSTPLQMDVGQRRVRRLNARGVGSSHSTAAPSDAAAQAEAGQAQERAAQRGLVTPTPDSNVVHVAFGASPSRKRV